jgi:hypothetical protein
MTARKMSGAQVRPEGLYALGDLLKKPEMLKPPEVIIPHMMWRKGRSCLFGREKSGKSTLLAHAVARASQGQKFLGQECQQSTFLWIGLEEIVAEAVRRFKDFGGDENRIWILDRLSRNWVQEIEQCIDVAKADGVIIDTLPQILASAGVKDENDAGGINHTFIPSLTKLTREQNVGVLLNGHTNKSEGVARGSTAITAGMDVNLLMKAPDGNTRPRRVVTSEGRWSNEEFTLQFDGEHYELTQGELALPDQIFQHIQKNPDCSRRSINKDLPGGTARKTELLKVLMESGQIEDHGDEKRSKYRVSKQPVSNGNGVTTVTGKNSSGTQTVTESSNATLPDSLPLESDLVTPPEDEEYLRDERRGMEEF